MDPQAVIDSIAALPFAPGSGPFRIKGVAYRGSLQFVDEVIEGGMNELRADFPLDGFRRFFEQPFLPSVLYDIFPLVLTTACVAKRQGRDFAELVDARARYQARKDLTGVYRLMLRLAPSTILAKRVPKLVAQYFDFGALRSLPVGPGHVQTIVGEVPVPLEPWLTTCLESYSTLVLETGGAQNVQAKAQRSELAGERAGVQLSTITHDVTWDA